MTNLTATNYEIGTYVSSVEGDVWTPLSLEDCGITCDAQAEAEVRRIGPEGAPTDFDGNALHGLYIRRNDAEWFCRF